MRPAKFLLVMYALVFCVMQTAQARACSCGAPATTAEALKRATAVFRGKVIKISVPTLDWIGLTRTGAHRVKFEILKQWKGPFKWLRAIPMAALVFVAGRILFARGYERGAPGRATGFALTAYPTFGMLATVAVTLLFRLLSWISG